MPETKLTNRDLSEIFYMILEGHSVREAAKKFGVSYQCVYQMLSKRGFDFKCNRIRKISNHYPNIVEWMNDHKCNKREFAEKVGMSYVTMNKVLTGKHNLRMSNIEKILSVTGLTYEEAFATEIKESEE